MDRDFPQAFLARLAAVQDRSELAGKVAKRTLLPGYPIPLNSIREPDAVTAGVPVQVVFQSGVLLITAQASPLKSAQAGEVVSVRNLESGRTISGVVQQDGTVLVGSM
jgi:flagella basal body P-ring formation protein FlgA